MNMPHHRLPREVFGALATGGGGPGAVRELAAAQYSKHVVLLHGVVAAARGSEQYPLALMGYDLLAQAWRADRSAAEKVIGYPAVGAWARRTIQACRGGPVMPGAEPGGLRAVGAAAAIHAGLAAEIEVTATSGRVMLPSLGAAEVPGRVAVVRCGDGRARVGPVNLPGYPYQDVPGWLGLRRARAGSLDILVDDLDPFRMPDAPGLSPRMQPGSAAEPWDAVFQRAWPMLERDRSVAAEIAAAVSVVVPRSRPPEGAASTTSPEAFGAVAMSLPPDPVSCAETLVHEVQHLKLAALLDIVALTLPDDGGRYYAPWRDDPRPLGGLLQGTYAYLGVTGFWRRQRQPDDGQRQADAKYARRRAAVALAVETLRSSGRLTSAGLDFVNGMAGTVRLWQDEPVPAQAEAEARRAAESHLARWRSANGLVRLDGVPG
jgi:HEXXH motif-containing protein